MSCRISRPCRGGHVVLPGVDVGAEEGAAGIRVCRGGRGGRVVSVVMVKVVRERREGGGSPGRNGVLVVADEEAGR